MIANKTFFFSPWTHNLFVPRKRAKWKVTSQWAFYNVAREEHSGSFPAFCHESCNSVRSPLLKSWICLFKQNKFLHVKVLCSFVRRSRWRKHLRGSLLSVSCTCSLLLQPTSIPFRLEIGKREIKNSTVHIFVNSVSRFTMRYLNGLAFRFNSSISEQRSAKILRLSFSAVVCYCPNELYLFYIDVDYLFTGVKLVHPVYLNQWFSRKCTRTCSILVCFSMHRFTYKISLDTSVGVWNCSCKNTRHLWRGKQKQNLYHGNVQLRRIVSIGSDEKNYSVIIWCYNL